MKFKPGDQRFGAALIAVLGLPEYLPGAAVAREEGHVGISSMTLLTPEQEVRLKSATTQLVEQVLRLQERNKETLKQRRKENERLKKVSSESVRNGETKLRPHQLEVLSFIRHNSGETVKKSARLYSQDDEIKNVKFLVTVCFLEACGLVRLRKSGVDKIPELTRDGHSLLASSKDPLASFKRPASTDDWRDLALAVVMTYQSGSNYSLEKLILDANKHCQEFGFDLVGMSRDVIQNGFASGVLDLERSKDILITHLDGKENIALREPEMVREEPKRVAPEKGPPVIAKKEIAGKEGDDVEVPSDMPIRRIREVDLIIRAALRGEIGG